MLFGHRCEYAVELRGISRLQELELHAQRSAGPPDLCHPDLMVWIGRVRQDCYAAGLGDGLRKQLELLCVNFHTGAAKGQPCDVPAWVREAFD